MTAFMCQAFQVPQMITACGHYKLQPKEEENQENCTNIMGDMLTFNNANWQKGKKNHWATREDWEDGTLIGD